MTHHHVDLIEILADTNPKNSTHLFATHTHSESSITKPTAHHD